MHSLSYIVYIVWCEGHHREAAILGHVDAVVSLEGLHLLLVQPRVAEHADLLSHMTPVPRGTWEAKMEL